MPDEDPSQQAGPDALSRKVGARETQKIRVRRTRDRTLWHGVGAAGVIGWSIAVPTLIGALVGLWLDRNWPGRISWTLALLLGGVALGCINAWYWVDRESEMIRREQADEDIDQ